MTLRLVLRTLAARPVRTAVLAGGFGFGVAVMAALLGVGDVIVEQSRSPALRGGGDLVVLGRAGDVSSARFLLSAVLGAPPLAGRMVAASPTKRDTLYLVEGDRLTRVRTRGGVPSLERAVADPEVSRVAAWQDAPADRTWTAPDPAALLRAMDRFHAAPDAPAWADSWAEWLYFNGRTPDGSVRFYLAFMAGAKTADGNRPSGVRLQLERDGRVESYSRRGVVPEAALLAGAPDLDVAGSRVRLEGQRYRITLDLDAEHGGPGASGEIVLEAPAGQSVPPFVLHGRDGWLSGYVVPVLSGGLTGRLAAGGRDVPLEGAMGYHDHNWGFWRGVSWQWGQVAHDGYSFLYGRVRPPADALAPETAARLPGVLAVMGPGGPIAFAKGALIEESSEAAVPGAPPDTIRVLAREPGLDVHLDVKIQDAIRTPVGRAEGRGADPKQFLQLRALYHVTGRVGDRKLDFTAVGSAETFSGMMALPIPRRRKTTQ